MANRYATKSGNWSDPTVWDGGVSLPTAGDVVRPNTYTVTIDQDITVSELRNDAASPAAAGGVFSVASSRAIIASCVFTTTGTHGIQFVSGISTVTGNLTGGSGSSGWPLNILNATVIWTGNFLHTTSHHLGSLSTGTLNLTGNWSSAISGTNCNGFTQNGGVMQVMGNLTAHTTSTDSGVYLITKTGGSLTVTGNVTGAGGAAVWNSSGQITVNGSIYAGSRSAAIWCYSSGMTNVHPNQPTAGPTFVLNGNLYDHANGTPAIICGSLLIHSSSTIETQKRINSSGTAGAARSLYTGGTNLGQPSATNVRSGTAFGASSEYTGTLAVPSPTLVAIGVPTDNTVGSYEPSGGASAADIADAVWDEARAGHATAGTFGEKVNAELDSDAQEQLSSIKSDTSKIKGRGYSRIERLYP